MFAYEKVKSKKQKKVREFFKFVFLPFIDTFRGAKKNVKTLT